MPAAALQLGSTKKVVPVSPVHSEPASPKEAQAGPPCLGKGWQTGSLCRTTQREFKQPGEEGSLVRAVWRGTSVDTVRSLIAARADPDELHEFSPPTAARDAGRHRRAMGHKVMTGSALTVALMHGDAAILRALVEGRANLEVPYRFIAGKRKVPWSGTPIYAAVAKGQLDMVKEMAALRADLQAKGHLDDRPNNTMLWGASYSGHAAIVRFLLENSADAPEVINHAAVNQDDERLSHTAVHIAARAGRAEVVELLIEARADASARAPHGDTPFTDAIDHGQTDVVRLLARYTPADVLGDRNMRYIFQENNNMVNIAAVAEGLRQADPALVDNSSGGLQIDDLVQFLASPGEAPLHILSTVFRRRQLTYWSKSKRLEHNTAHIKERWTNDDGTGFNTAIGPTYTRFSEHFDDGMEHAEEEYTKWLDTLLQRKHLSGTREPVETLECTIAGIDQNPRVMHAIVTAANMEILEDLGCQAIIQVSWEDFFASYCMSLATNLALIFLFLFITYDVNAGHVDGIPPVYADVALVFMYILSLRNTLQELAQMLGYLSLHLFREQYLSVMNVIDVAQILLSWCCLVLLAAERPAYREQRSLVHRHILGFTVFLRWMKVLYNLRGFESIGPRMLPILRTMHDVVPFLTVVVCPLLGFAHFYWALGFKHYLSDAFFIMYRLGFLGDFDVAEMVDSEMGLEPGEMWVLTLVVVIGFVMTITMMNVFIGVLSESYTRAYQVRDRLFWLSRAEIVLDHLASQRGLPCFARWHCNRSKRGAVEGATSLWYCRPKRPLPKSAAEESQPAAAACPGRADWEALGRRFDAVEVLRSQVEGLETRMEGLAASLAPLAGLQAGQAQLHGLVESLAGKLQPPPRATADKAVGPDREPQPPEGGRCTPEGAAGGTSDVVLEELDAMGGGG